MLLLLLREAVAKFGHGALRYSAVVGHGLLVHSGVEYALAHVFSIVLHTHEWILIDQCVFLSFAFVILSHASLKFLAQDCLEGLV